VKILERLTGSFPVQVLLTLVGYSFYAAVLGISLAPSIFVTILAFLRFIAPAVRDAGVPAAGSIVVFALCLAGSFFIFFFFGLLVMGILMRIISLGVKPGRHRGVSMVTLFWILEGGIFTLAWRMLLAYVPMTFVSQMFYRLSGCRLGKNVWINTLQLNDPYLVSIGDNTVIGGDAVITPHVYESGSLILEPVRIGKNCLIGAEAYICPGVTIGDGSVIGLRASVRRGTTVPPGSRILSPAGLPPDRVYEIERGPRVTGHGRR
jgi:hypothetical protein